ncbi:TDE2712 family protein [Tissierella praeacuta]|uniref:TDE2712 family protein n=1 Tax=Tissierella praeacuta TaxID=43131 RepID=UPI003DA5AEF7
MVKTIKINFDTVEMMLFIWQSIADKEKVVDSFFIELANKEEMKYLYNSDFNEDSVRKVLSAISNREVLNNSTKQERKFWNNNMWMLEDLGNMNNMVKPVKTLNLDDVKEKLSGETKFEELEVIFIPGHEAEYYIDENKLVINFFRLMVDFMDETKVNISGKPLKEYVEEKLLEIVK